MSDEEFQQFWEYSNLKRFMDLFGSDNTTTLIDVYAAKNPNIKNDLALLDKALEGLNSTMSEMDVLSIFDYIEAYEPTGQVT